MIGNMCLRTLSVAVISIFLITCCVAEKPQNADELRYKNHRTSNADIPTVANKFPAQVSNARDYETTEAPGDAVRLFITPPVSKRKPNQTAVPASTASRVQQTTTAPATSAVKNPASPTYYVTAVASKSAPIYSPLSAVKDAMEQHAAAAVDDGPKRRLTRLNGTKTAQDRAHTHLLYATAQPSTVPDARGPKDATPFPTVGRVVAGNASKPFATVIVPKKMLETVDYARDDSSFRPMASPSVVPLPVVPSFGSYKRPQTQTDADAGSRWATNAIVKTEHSSGALNKRGNVQLQKTSSPSASYKVEEHVPTEQPPLAVFNKGYSGVQAEAKSQDRFGATYGPSENAESEKHKQHEQVKRQENAIPSYGFTKHETIYGGPAAVADTFAYEKPNVFYKNAADRHRDGFYAQATAEPSYSPYNSAAAAGKYELVKSPSFEYEKSHTPSHKEPIAGPSSSPWLFPTDAGRDNAELSMDDANAKDVLKFLLRDVFKSKQHGELKSKSSGMDEIMDAYFKNGRPNVDFSLDNYDIETDMSCNLRSTKYISDGQCVTTRPIVEAVCADRCLVYSSSLTTQRQRISSLVNQQVEALHCVDGDVKFVRVQLKCRDGNAVNNVIKVVTNCRCKLHQIQPQVRSNSPVAMHNI